MLEFYYLNNINSDHQAVVGFDHVEILLITFFKPDQHNNTNVKKSVRISRHGVSGWNNIFKADDTV